MRSWLLLVTIGGVALACSSTTNNNVTIIEADAGDASTPADASASDAGVDASSSDAGGDAPSEAGPECTGSPVPATAKDDCWPAGPCLTQSCSLGRRYFCKSGTQDVFGGFPRGLNCVNSNEGSGDSKFAACCLPACVRIARDCGGQGLAYACPVGVAPKGTCTSKGPTPDPIAQAGFAVEGETFCCQ